MDIIFATGNMGKVREAGEILGAGFHIIPAAEAGVTEDVAETGGSLAENSLLKAMHVWEACGRPCFADDSGLEVDVLNGAPGVLTARYAGEGKDFNANINKLLREMENAGPNRCARFRCVVTLIIDGEPHIFEGVLEGRIAFARSGQGGFGYDPIFIADEHPDKTLAEIPEETKNAISHRGKAVRAMAEWLNHHYLCTMSSPRFP